MHILIQRSSYRFIVTEMRPSICDLTKKFGKEVFNKYLYPHQITAIESLLFEKNLC